MDRVIGILRTMLPVMLMLGIGVLCREKKLLSRQGVDALKTVAVQIGLPANLLHAFAVTEYSTAALAAPLIMFAVCCLAWALGRGAGRLLGVGGPFLPFLTTGFEAGMMGYVLFSLLYGSGRLPEFARIDLGQVLFVFTLYKALLAMKTQHEPGFARIAKEMAASPVIWAIAAGVLLGATGLYAALIPSGAAGVLDACTDFISAPVAALILLSIGYDLDVKQIRWRDALAAVGLRLVIMAALGAGVLALFQALWPQETWTQAVCLMFLLPPPFVLSVFSDDQSQRAFLSSALSVSILVTLAGFGALAVIG